MPNLNVPNRTLFHGDNLPFLRGINSESVHLIATDPPFNKNKDFHATPDSLAAGAGFQDRWSWRDDIHDEWLDALQDSEHEKVWAVITSAKIVYGDDMAAFLCFMAVRLLEMYRILRPDGSLYLHCDHTAVAYLRQLLDAVFGKNNFLNEVVWAYRKWTNAATHFQRNHDSLLVYAKSKGQHTFNKLFDPNAPQVKKYERGWDTNVVEGNIRQLIVYDRSKARAKIDGGAYDRVVYRDEQPRVALPDHWNIAIINSQAEERTGYPTQKKKKKPLALYERIIQASSNLGDMVLDPFCGCATTPIAAERLGRQWIGMDLWNEAHAIILKRLQDEGLAGPDGSTDRLLTFGEITLTSTAAGTHRRRRFAGAGL